MGCRPQNFFSSRKFQQNFNDRVLSHKSDKMASEMTRPLSTALFPNRKRAMQSSLPRPGTRILKRTAVFLSVIDIGVIRLEKVCYSCTDGHDRDPEWYAALCSNSDDGETYRKHPILLPTRPSSSAAPPYVNQKGIPFSNTFLLQVQNT